MSYKTIVVHIDHEAQAETLLKAAVRLAGQNDAHLIGTYVAHALEPYMARASEIALSTEITKTLMREEIKRAAAIQGLFEKATKDQNLVSEWRFDPTQRSSVESAVQDIAKSADVLMIGSDYQEPPTGMVHGHVAPLIMGCARPVVVVPEAYQDKSLGDFVFVAWDGSRESSRAIFDSLPLLERAQSVWVHRVISSDEAKRHGENVTRDIADALSRHGVDLELSESVSSARKVGEEILNAASGRGADCIVMGAYGHSRMHNFLLGGATKHLIANSGVPLIMSR